jgi:hypothetical protein
MLRIKKPQPAFLSRVIRNKIDQMGRHWRHVDTLSSSGMLEAQNEDRWDQIVGLAEQGNTFQRTMVSVLRDLQKQENRRNAKRNDLAKKMVRRYEQEKQLAEHEWIARKVQKNAERKARTLLRKASRDTNDHLSSNYSSEPIPDAS